LKKRHDIGHESLRNRQAITFAAAMDIFFVFDIHEIEAFKTK
jgi:hypothetical protein